MNETKRPHRLTIRQWLALDTAGSFLAGCGVFFYSGYLLCLYDDFGVVFIMVLYTVPLPLTLDLAALFLGMARSTFPAWRVLTAVGAVIQILAAAYHFLMWSVLKEMLLDLLLLSMLAAGIAGLWAVIVTPREPKSPAK